MLSTWTLRKLSDWNKAWKKITTINIIKKNCLQCNDWIRRLSKLSSHTSDTTSSQVFCFLCNGQHPNMSSPTQWKKDDARKFLSYNIPKEGVVCQPCRKDIARVLSNSGHVPQWSKPCNKGECSTKWVQKCCICVITQNHQWRYN